MGALALVGTVASTGLAMYGQHQQSRAQIEAARYNQKLAEIEATHRETEAREGISRAAEQNRSQLSHLRHRLSASGARIDTGTPLALMGEAAGRLHLSIADAGRAAALEARAVREQGRIGLWQAKTAAKASRLNMIATGIQGATSAFQTYDRGQHLGVYPRTRSVT
jgi:hypothetical protein